MGKYLIAHDLGTSGNKASLFSTSGQLIDSCTIPYEVHFLTELCRAESGRLVECGGRSNKKNNGRN